MIYVGVDIAKQQHQVAAVDERGKVILAPFKILETQQGFRKLHKQLLKLGTPEEVRIGMEATGHYWLLLHAHLLAEGWTVEVFNPVITAQAPAARLRGRKTDADDAVGIALTIREGGFVPFEPLSEQCTLLKTLCRQRQYHANELRNAKKRFGGVVDRVFPEFSKHFSDPYGKTALAVLKAFPSAHALAKAHLKSIKSLIREVAGARMSADFAAKLREAARKSPARDFSDTGREIIIPVFIEHLENLQATIKQLEALIEEQYLQMETLMKTIPGIGVTVGPVIASELGDLERYRKPKTASNRRSKPTKRILAMAGLDPRVRESGTFKGRSKMSKRGSQSLRTALFQAASMARLHSPGFEAIYQRQIAKGKHHYVAVSHVARKLVEVIWAIHNSGQPFSEDLLINLEKSC